MERPSFAKATRIRQPGLSRFRLSERDAVGMSDADTLTGRDGPRRVELRRDAAKTRK